MSDEKEEVKIHSRDWDQTEKFVVREIEVCLKSSTVGNAQLQEDAKKLIDDLRGK